MAEGEDYGHVPESILDIAVAITAWEPEKNPSIPTIFIGIVEDPGAEASYTSAHWNNNRDRVKDLFGITTDSLIIELIIHPMAGNNNKRVDSQRLAKDVKGAVEKLKDMKKDDCIRIVRMGIGNAVAMEEAIERLIRSWQRDELKTIQFIGLGETSDRDWLNFCNSLVLSKQCGKVLYYNTMNYNVFGEVESHRHNTQGNVPRSIEQLAKMLQSAKQKTGGNSDSNSRDEKRDDQG